MFLLLSIENKKFNIEQRGEWQITLYSPLKIPKEFLFHENVWRSQLLATPMSSGSNFRQTH